VFLLVVEEGFVKPDFKLVTFFVGLPETAIGLAESEWLLAGRKQLKRSDQAVGRVKIKARPEDREREPVKPAASKAQTESTTVKILPFFIPS